MSTYPQPEAIVTAEAVAAAERGWRVQATERRQYGNGDWGWPQFGPTIRDPAEVAQRFAEGGSWHGKAAAHLVTGVLVDIDPQNDGTDDGLDLPYTVTTRTPNGGTHHYYALPAELQARVVDEELTSFKYRNGVDVILSGPTPLPGVEKPEGPYTWQVHPEEAEIAAAPNGLTDAITRKLDERAAVKASLPEIPKLAALNGLPPAVSAILSDKGDVPDRSSRFAYLIRTAVEHDFTDEQVWAAVNRHEPSLSKYGDRSDFWTRTATEIATHRGKLEAGAIADDLEFDPGGVVFDAPAEPEAVWGNGAEVLIAKDEAGIVYGHIGVGKTTMVQRVALGAIGVEGKLLGYSIAQIEGKVLYIAADRPSQAMRSLRRMVTDEHRKLLDARWLWERRRRLRISLNDPERFAAQVVESGAELLIIDSVKDITPKVSTDEGGLAYNEAIQRTLVGGVQVIALHHPRKATGEGRSALTLDDVYGSTWIAAGAGSVIALNGTPGTGVARLEHLKPPAEQVGPFDVDFDYDAGTVTTIGVRELSDFLARRGTATTQEAVQWVTGKDRPTETERKRVVRKLNRMVEHGQAIKAGGGRGHLVVWKWNGQRPEIEKDTQLDTKKDTEKDTEGQHPPEELPIPYYARESEVGHQKDKRRTRRRTFLPFFK